MCDKCYGFFQKYCYSRDTKLCMLNFEVRLQALTLHFQKHKPADFDSYPNDFKSCIIGTMLNDEIGKIYKVDKLILIFGCRLFDRSRRKLEKIGEVQQFIRMKMRKLGSLLQVFNEKELLRIEYKNGLDMFLCHNVDVLEICVEARTFTDDPVVKAGLKHRLYYTRKHAAGIWKGTFLVQENDFSSKEMDDFLTVLGLFTATMPSMLTSIPRMYWRALTRGH